MFSKVDVLIGQYDDLRNKLILLESKDSPGSHDDELKVNIRMMIVCTFNSQRSFFRFIAIFFRTFLVLLENMFGTYCTSSMSLFEYAYNVILALIFFGKVCAVDKLSYILTLF